jgi:hypothetical protein
VLPHRPVEQDAEHVVGVGDIEAMRRPHKIPKRVANKLLGRGIVSKLWR